MDEHKGYRISTGIITLVLSGLIFVAGLQVTTLLAIGALGAFVTPSYELGLANKMFKLFMFLI